METVKNVVSVMAGIIGVMTALLTLYAKYLDIKKAAVRDKVATPPEPTPPDPSPGLELVEEAPIEVVARVVPRPSNSAAAIERSRIAVRAPAITLIVAGLVSLFSNLFLGGFGFVDRFVTPLTSESKARVEAGEALRRGGMVPSGPARSGEGDGSSEEANFVLTICTLLSLSVASAAAVWAGIGMIRLKSYWLSVAGSFAIMAGGGFCCMLGLPIGIWSLSVLYKPEVAESFR